MPLFNKKFELKPIPPRNGRCSTGCPAVNEEADDFKNISLSLGNRELRFADGVWIHSTRKADIDEVVRLNSKLKNAEKQIYMCHLKIELLLDLLAEHASELCALKTEEQ